MPGDESDQSLEKGELTVIAFVALKRRLENLAGWAEGPLPVGATGGEARTPAQEKSERTRDWKAGAAALMYGEGRVHQDLGSRAPVLAGWRCLALEALNVTPDEGAAGSAGCYGIIHLEQATNNARRALKDLRRDLPGLASSLYSEAGDNRIVFLISYYRPAPEGVMQRSSDCYAYLNEAATGFDGIDEDARAEGDQRTILPERLRPSTSWRLVVARSGLAAVATKLDTFTAGAAELMRTTYTDASLFALLQRDRAEYLENRTQGTFAHHLEGDQDGKSHAAALERDLTELRALLDDARFGVLAAQPWARVGTYVDVHAALSDQLRVPQAIEASDLAAERLLVMVQEQLQGKRDRFLALVSAMLIFPGLVAGFAPLGWTAGQIPLFAYSLAVSVVLSCVFYLSARHMFTFEASSHQIQGASRSASPSEGSAPTA